MMINSDEYLRRFIAESQQRHYFLMSCVDAYNLRRRWAKVIKTFQKQLKKKKENTSIRVLDIGCNLGELIFYLNDRFDGSHKLDFTGIEISEEAVAVAKSKTLVTGVNNVAFQVGNAEELSLEDESYNIVICMEILEHLTSPDKAINEIHRVLKKGGLAIICTPDTYSVSRRMLRWYDRVFLRGRFQSGEKEAEEARMVGPEERVDRERWTSAAGYGHISEKSAREWTGLLSTAGLRQIKSRKGWPLVIPQLANDRPFILGTAIILDWLADLLPSWINRALTNGLLFEARKV